MADGSRLAAGLSAKMRRSPLQRFHSLLIVIAFVAAGCHGREGSASAASGEGAQVDPYIDAQPLALLESISPAIPVYPGLEYSPDLTRQDNLNADRMYGAESEVWTFVTPNSFPKVWHYYTTWLGLFRAYDAPDSIPPPSPSWRTHQINLNAVMQDPFVPGDEIEPGANRVVLELAETDTRTHTVVRYIISPTIGPEMQSPVPASTVPASGNQATPGD